MGTSSSTEIMQRDLGFELTMNGDGDVAAVTLVNDEVELGHPPSTSNFSAFTGMLPGNLDWGQTAMDLGVEYGAPNQFGGFGTAITFEYTTADGEFEIKIAFDARNEADLPSSLMHWIKVTRN